MLTKTLHKIFKPKKTHKNQKGAEEHTYSRLSRPRNSETKNSNIYSKLKPRTHTSQSTSSRRPLPPTPSLNSPITHSRSSTTTQPPSRISKLTQTQLSNLKTAGFGIQSRTLANHLANVRNKGLSQEAQEKYFETLKGKLNAFKRPDKTSITSSEIQKAIEALQPNLNSPITSKLYATVKQGTVMKPNPAYATRGSLGNPSGIPIINVSGEEEITGSSQFRRQPEIRRKSSGLERYSPEDNMALLERSRTNNTIDRQSLLDASARILQHSPERPTTASNALKVKNFLLLKSRHTQSGKLSNSNEQLFADAIAVERKNAALFKRMSEKFKGVGTHENPYGE